MKNKLCFVGVVKDTLGRKDYILRKKGNCYYFVGENTYSKSDIQNYLEELSRFLEFTP